MIYPHYDIDEVTLDALNDVYIIYSIDKSMEGKAIYPDEPRVIEALVKGATDAFSIVDYMRAQDDTRLYGCECWEIHPTAYHYWKRMKELEEEFND